MLEDSAQTTTGSEAVMMEVSYLCSAPHPLLDFLLAHFFFFCPRQAAAPPMKKTSSSQNPASPSASTSSFPASDSRGLVLCVLDNFDCLFLSNSTTSPPVSSDPTLSKSLALRQEAVEFTGRGIERVFLVSKVTRIRLSQADAALIMTTTAEQNWRPLPPVRLPSASSSSLRGGMSRKHHHQLDSATTGGGGEFNFETLGEMLSVLPSLLALPRSQTTSILTFLETSEIISSRNAAQTATALNWVSRKTHALLTRTKDNFTAMCCKLAARARPLLEASPKTLSLVLQVESAQLKILYLRALLRRESAVGRGGGGVLAGPPAQVIALLDSGSAHDRDSTTLLTARQDMYSDLDRTSRGFVTAAQQMRVWVCWATLLHLSPLPPTVQLTIDTDKLLPSTRARIEHFKACEERRQVMIKVLDKTAAATLREDLRTSQTLVAARRWVGERVGNALGTVGNLVGAKMFYEPTWECEAHPKFGREMREMHFVLSPSVTHLNNSDFPLEPKPVRVARQQWRRCVQIDPVLFRFKSQLVRLLQCVVKLSKKLLCSTSDICLAPSFPHALFTVLRSLTWAPCDRFLMVNPPENGQLLSQVSSLLHAELGVEIVVVRLDPFLTHEETVREFIRILRMHKPIMTFFPHVDHCARVLPIAEMVAACHENASLSFVDGSDAVGNVTTNVNMLGSDVYAARIDNYLMASPGNTVLIVKPTLQPVIDSLIVSYYYGDGFSSEWTYTGLTDISAVLSSYQALQYVKYICFGMREYCRNLAAEATAYLCRSWHVYPLKFPDQDVHAVAIVKIPSTDGCSSSDALHLSRTLVEWKVNVGIVCVRTHHLARMEESGAGRPGEEFWKGPSAASASSQQHEVSFLAARLTCHIYNDMTDVKRLAAAVLRFVKIKGSR